MQVQQSCISAPNINLTSPVDVDNACVLPSYHCALWITLPNERTTAMQEDPILVRLTPSLSTDAKSNFIKAPMVVTL